VRVRPATPSDYGAMCSLWSEIDRLHARLLPDYFRISAQPPRTREEYDAALRSGDEHLAVVEDGGAVVGLVHVQLYDTPRTPQMTPRRRAHVDSLVVATPMRRRGLGRRLLEEAAFWARTRGADDLVLTVWAGNEDAERFYDAVGFTRVSSVLGKAL